MARVYATDTDYVDFSGGDLEDATDAILARASREVEKHIRAAVYETDDNGLPTETAVAEALRDATCAYVAYWVETGDPTGADALAGPVKILSVTLGGTATGGASSRSVSDTRRADEAVTILRNAGLISSVTAHS